MKAMIGRIFWVIIITFLTGCEEECLCQMGMLAIGHPPIDAAQNIPRRKTYRPNNQPKYKTFNTQTLTIHDSPFAISFILYPPPSINFFILRFSVQYIMYYSKYGSIFLVALTAPSTFAAILPRQDTSSSTSVTSVVSTDTSAIGMFCY